MTDHATKKTKICRPWPVKQLADGSVSPLQCLRFEPVKWVEQGLSPAQEYDAFPNCPSLTVIDLLHQTTVPDAFAGCDFQLPDNMIYQLSQAIKPSSHQATKPLNPQLSGTK